MRRIRRQKTSSNQDTAFSHQVLENAEYLQGFVRRMAELAAQAPDDLEDIDLEEALVAEGTDRLMARRLVTFVPIAFGQVVLAGLGLQPGTTFTFSE